ncbi:hypothetical protein [Gulosibacter molinativorax]|nr:hypothetical protein [Gulosibacter molinativorax]QUY60893.1 Hypotetical protein [Gulosibacter molinativorax]
MILPIEIGEDDDLAREILVIGRVIAPCISSLEGEGRADALAILKRVYKDTRTRGQRFVKSQSIGPARVDYTDVQSMFDGAPTMALRALCGGSSVGGLSKGSFPKDRPVGKIWPEE